MGPSNDFLKFTKEFIKGLDCRKLLKIIRAPLPLTYIHLEIDIMDTIIHQYHIISYPVPVL